MTPDDTHWPAPDPYDDWVGRELVRDAEQNLQSVKFVLTERNGNDDTQPRHDRP